MEDVAGPARTMVAPGHLPIRSFDLIHKHIDRGAVTGGDVPDAKWVFGSGEPQEGLHDVKDMHEVPPLATVAVDNHAATCDRLVDEGRHDGSLSPACWRSP